MMFLIHAGCGFGCGVLIMHLLTLWCRPGSTSGETPRPRHAEAHVWDDKKILDRGLEIY
jgi:hypothetical protein